jgi:hypothetical protein
MKTDLLSQLKEPFAINELKWRVGATTGDKSKGIALAYIDARNVMKRLDEVVGIENWQCRYPFAGCCEIGIRIKSEWIWKSNCAGESNIDGTKGMASDSFKRAAAVWGVGRYLYYLDNQWVPIKSQGKSYVIVEPPVLPKWAMPYDKSEKKTVKRTNNKKNKNTESVDTQNNPIDSDWISKETNHSKLTKAYSALEDQNSEVAKMILYRINELKENK